MRILLDTNILVRLVQPGHPMRLIADDAVAELLRRKDELCIVPQNLYEFWAVCTRPAAQNGLNFSVAQVDAELTRPKGVFKLLPDSAAILPQWEFLVRSFGVTGKNAHDARLVAAMIVHGVDQLLT